MADIAAVFGWAPAAFERMTLEDLVAWRARAVTRWRRMNGIKED